jgi:hypothetical protein
VTWLKSKVNVGAKRNITPYVTPALFFPLPLSLSVLIFFLVKTYIKKKKYNTLNKFAWFGNSGSLTSSFRPSAIGWKNKIDQPQLGLSFVALQPWVYVPLMLEKRHLPYLQNIQYFSSLGISTRKEKQGKNWNNGEKILSQQPNFRIKIYIRTIGS